MVKVVVKVHTVLATTIVRIATVYHYTHDYPEILMVLALPICVKAIVNVAMTKFAQ